jgi:hypothetical protein
MKVRARAGRASIPKWYSIERKVGSRRSSIRKKGVAMSKQRSVNRIARLLPLIAFLLVSSAALHAQLDPAVGTWQLDLAKSKYAPGTAPANLRVTVEAAGQGVRVTATTVRQNGQKIVVEYTAYLDGKDYPVTGSPDYDTVSLKRNGKMVEGTRKKDGKVVQTYQRIVSDDRKTMTVATTGKDASGNTLNSVAVFDRR